MAHHHVQLLVALTLTLVLLATRDGTAVAGRPAGAATEPIKAAAPANVSQDFLDAHNQARAEVGVPPLRWSQMLANLTSRQVRYQRDKMSCQFANLTSGKYGGNQLWASGQPVPPRAAVEAWVTEKAFYNHADNSCAPDHQCGVYTQVVWRKSEEVGCAQATCAKDTTTLTICFYNPPGNVVGESPY